ncbi:hypothetical protein AN958_03196 [Leucoagaricus sp. SymC.cos]|nr:hypothetical protein AN958_03196 [Leucoagaricus sp. SymC.cos]
MSPCFFYQHRRRHSLVFLIVPLPMNHRSASCLAERTLHASQNSFSSTEATLSTPSHACARQLFKHEVICMSSIALVECGYTADFSPQVTFPHIHHPYPTNFAPMQWHHQLRDAFFTHQPEAIVGLLEDSFSTWGRSSHWQPEVRLLFLRLGADCPGAHTETRRSTHPYLYALRDRRGMSSRIYIQNMTAGQVRPLGAMVSLVRISFHRPLLHSCNFTRHAYFHATSPVSILVHMYQKLLADISQVA